MAPFRRHTILVLPSAAPLTAADEAGQREDAPYDHPPVFAGGTSRTKARHGVQKKVLKFLSLGRHDQPQPAALLRTRTEAPVSSADGCPSYDELEDGLDRDGIAEGHANCRASDLPYTLPPWSLDLPDTVTPTLTTESIPPESLTDATPSRSTSPHSFDGDKHSDISSKSPPYRTLMTSTVSLDAASSVYSVGGLVPHDWPTPPNDLRNYAADCGVLLCENPGGEYSPTLGDRGLLSSRPVSLASLPQLLFPDLWWLANLIPGAPGDQQIPSGRLTPPRTIASPPPGSSPSTHTSTTLSSSSPMSHDSPTFGTPMQLRDVRVKQDIGKGEDPLSDFGSDVSDGDGRFWRTDGTAADDAHGDPAPRPNQLTMAGFSALFTRMKGLFQNASVTRTTPQFSEHSVPTESQLVEASSIHVYDHTGANVSFGSLIQDQVTIVVFIRHFLCAMCMDYMREIVTEMDPDALEEVGVKLIVIGGGDPRKIKAYSQGIFHSPFPLYVDPQQRLYRALGMTRKTSDKGPEEEKGAYIRHGPVEGALAAAEAALSSKMPLVKIIENMGQLGGEFVLGPGSRCSYAHRMINTRSHAPITTVAEHAGVRSFYPHAHRSRETQQSPKLGAESGENDDSMMR